jgi:hypothetical protein
MKVRIPLVVTKSGWVNGWVTQEPSGKHTEDVGLLYDCIPDSEIAREIYVEVDLDLELIFKNYVANGKMVEV